MKKIIGLLLIFVSLNSFGQWQKVLNGQSGLTVRNEINANDSSLYSNKVDKITGKGLTKNELTDVLKAKYDSVSLKQNTLISGTNIKTINGNSVLASGNLQIGACDSVAYSTAFPFSKQFTYMVHTMIDNDSITINHTNEVLGGGGFILFINNPSYIPKLGVFSVFNQTVKYNLTGIYDNTEKYSLLIFIHFFGSYFVAVQNSNQ